MLAISLPVFPLVPTASPLLFLLGPHPVSVVGSSTMMGEQESGLPLENPHGIVSIRVPIGTKARLAREKGKGRAYVELVQE